MVSMKFIKIEMIERILSKFIIFEVKFPLERVYLPRYIIIHNIIKEIGEGCFKNINIDMSVRLY